MSGASALAVSVLIGAAFAAGILCLASVAPRWRAAGLEARIAPHLRDVSDPAGTTAPTPPRARHVVAAMTERAGVLLSRFGGGDETVRRRLAQAAVPGGVARFRVRQLTWAVAGLLGGAAVGVAAALAGRGGLPVVVAAPVGAVLGAMLCDLWLQRVAHRRVARLEEELPAVLEFMSLCLAAGEGLLDSVRRVSQSGAGELPTELRGVVVEIGTGSSSADALGRMARRLDLPALSRAVDQLVASMDRGAPLARVLQEQAGDARDEAKRRLIERAGRAEIWMMLPLVFLILPLSVLFAVYPGVFMLQLGLG